MYSLRGPSWRPPRFAAAVAAGVAAAVVLVLLAGAFAGGRATDPDDPPSDARLEAARLEADRVVRVVGDAIAHPRQESADGLARAALGTTAAQDGRLAVLAAEDLGAPGAAADPEAAVARLRLRVELGGPGEPAPDAAPGPAPFVACYDVEFTAYGPRDEAEPVACPAGAPAYVPPTTAPPPALPPDTTDRLRTALGALPPADRHDESAVLAAVTALGLGTEPGVHTAAGPVVGVAVRLGDDCVLARTLPDGTVEAWVPPRVTVEPGEAGCTATTAAAPPPSPH
jgi:hypothetical protein